MQGYESFTNSGNDILDTILTGKQLYCPQHQIHMNVVANGSQLSHLEAMDLCTIFGNALDNAIECVEQLPELEKQSQTSESPIRFRLEPYRAFVLL